MRKSESSTSAENSLDEIFDSGTSTLSADVLTQFTGLNLVERRYWIRQVGIWFRVLPSPMTELLQKDRSRAAVNHL